MTQTVARKNGYKQAAQARRLLAESQGPAKHVIEATVLMSIDTKVMKAVATKAFRKGNVFVQPEQTFFLVQSSKFHGRYYVVIWNEERLSWQCSCGANCKSHAHTQAAESYVKEHIVAKQHEEQQAVEPVEAPAAVETPSMLQEAIADAVNALREQMEALHVDIRPEMDKEQRIAAWNEYKRQKHILTKQMRHELKRFAEAA